MSSDKPILGIIGGGQLGSMLCQAAKKLNILTTILTDDLHAPAQSFCDTFVHSDYKDSSTLEKFAKSCDYITFEILEKISSITKVNPDPNINKIVQNRFTEKNFLKTLGIATTSYTF